LIGLITKPYHESTGNVYNDAVNIFSNRLEMFSRGFGHLHTTNKEFIERFERLEVEVNKKLDTTVYKTKSKKTKKKLRDEVSLIVLTIIECI